MVGGGIFAAANFPPNCRVARFGGFKISLRRINDG
jgi:hypothetical protein